MHRVSIIICTYNSSETIERLLASIDSQEGLGIEFELEKIIVDDCSTDMTPEILRSKGIFFYSTYKNTGGPNTGRNIGLSKATGDSITIADHDDYWHPDRIIKMLPLLNIAPIATSGFKAVDLTQNKVMLRVNQSSTGNDYNVYSKNETFLSKLTKRRDSQNTYLGSILFKSHLKENLFETVYGMVDFDWVLHLFYNQSSVEYCGALYTRYIGKQNLSLSEAYRINDFSHSLNAIESYAKEFPSAVNLSKKKIHGTMARYYYMCANMQKARYYLRKSNFNVKTILYYITSFAGSKWVNRNFPVFK